MGPVIVFALGLGAGALLQRPGRRSLAWTLLAAAVAALTWVLGTFAFLALSAPGELGPPLPLPLLLTFATALGGSLCGRLLRRRAEAGSTG